jgi:hypothetical protein
MQIVLFASALSISVEDVKGLHFISSRRIYDWNLALPDEEHDIDVTFRVMCQLKSGFRC